MHFSWSYSRSYNVYWDYKSMSKYCFTTRNAWTLAKTLAGTLNKCSRNVLTTPGMLYSVYLLLSTNNGAVHYNCTTVVLRSVITPTTPGSLSCRYTSTLQILRTTHHIHIVRMCKHLTKDCLTLCTGTAVCTVVLCSSLIKVDITKQLFLLHITLMHSQKRYHRWYHRWHPHKHDTSTQSYDTSTQSYDYILTLIAVTDTSTDTITARQSRSLCHVTS